MNEQPGLSDQYRMASPWPLFVALGIPVAELGVLFDVFPVAVAGLLLFCGSVAGLLRESEYVSSPWLSMGAFAVLLVGIGVAFAFTDIDLVTRGYAIITAGVVLAVGAVGGSLFVPDDAVV
ncbi:MAG: cox cluster protein [Haloferacaceae archaeon]